MPLPRAIIYTDGGAKPNPGPGGWGAVVFDEDHDEHPRELVGSEPETTNNRMELTAAMMALRSLKEPHRVRLHTDSKYVRTGITQWMASWRRKGWRLSLIHI